MSRIAWAFLAKEELSVRKGGLPRSAVPAPFRGIDSGIGLP